MKIFENVLPLNVSNIHFRLICIVKIFHLNNFKGHFLNIEFFLHPQIPDLKILSYHNNGKLIYSAFRWCINLNFDKLTLKTGFVVQGHIYSWFVGYAVKKGMSNLAYVTETILACHLTSLFSVLDGTNLSVTWRMSWMIVSWWEVYIVLLTTVHHLCVPTGYNLRHVIHCTLGVYCFKTYAVCPEKNNSCYQLIH